MNRTFRILIAAFVALLATGSLALVALGQDGGAQPVGSDMTLEQEGQTLLGSGFSYQGYLTHNGGPADGHFDFSFGLFNAPIGGLEVGGNEALNVPVNEGVFTTVIDAGSAVFTTGGTRWLSVATRPTGELQWTVLPGRQEIRPVPQAMYAAHAGQLADPGPTIIQVSPYDAIESDGGSNLTFDAQGNGRLRIVRNALGNDFVYIPVDVPAQIFGNQQQLALESLRFCYNGELVGNVIHGGVVRATVRQVSNFNMSSMLGEVFAPVLTADDECVIVTADTPVVVSGSMWVRFEVITGDLAPVEFTEISLTFTSDN